MPSKVLASLHSPQCTQVWPNRVASKQIVSACAAPFRQAVSVNEIHSNNKIHQQQTNPGMDMYLFPLLVKRKTRAITLIH